MLKLLQFTTHCKEVGQFSGAARLCGHNPTLGVETFGVVLFIDLADQFGFLFLDGALQGVMVSRLEG